MRRTVAVSSLVVACVLGAGAAQARGALTCDFVMGAAAEVCVYTNGDVTVENTSYSVIDVKKLSSPTVLTLQQRALATSIPEIAARAAVPGTCYVSLSRPTWCTVPPGRVALAQSLDGRIPQLEIKFDTSRSLAYNSAAALGGVLEQRLFSPKRSLVTKAGQCAVSASKSLSTPEDWGVALRDGINTSLACKPVVNELRKALGTKTAVASEWVVTARSIFRGIWLDELLDLAGLVVRR